MDPQAQISVFHTLSPRRMRAWVLSHWSRVRLFATPWTAAYQAPLSMGFSRQEYWSGFPCPSPPSRMALGKSFGFLTSGFTVTLSIPSVFFVRAILFCAYLLTYYHLMSTLCAGRVQSLESQSERQFSDQTTIVKVKVAQLHLTLSDPMDYTVHGILQARILEWVAIPFSRGSSQPRDWTQLSHIAGEFFTSWAAREAQEYWSG